MPLASADQGVISPLSRRKIHLGDTLRCREKLACPEPVVLVR